MATLKDLWNYPNNSGSGNVADTTHWSGDNSYGADKRVNELITGTYKSWPNLTPSTDLSITPLVASQEIAQYVNYLDSFSDYTNLTFNQIYNHELVEWSLHVNGKTVSSMDIVNAPSIQPDRVLLKITTSTAHNLSDMDPVRGFAFGGTANEDILNWENFYAKVIDSTSFYAWNHSSGTTPFLIGDGTKATIAGEDIQPLNYWFVRQNAGGYDGLLLCFPSQGWYDAADSSPTNLTRTEVTGDTLKIRADHSGNSLAGTIDSAAVDTTIYLEKVRNNVYKCFTDSARTTPFTITSEVTGPSTHTISYTTTVGSYGAIFASITSSSLHDFLVSHSITSFRESRNTAPTSFVGVCRLNLNAGTSSSSTKTIPSSLDQSDYFYYLYKPGEGTDLGYAYIYEDLGATNNYFTTSTWATAGWTENQGSPNTQPAGHPKGVEVQSVGTNEIEVEFLNAWQLDMAYHKVPGDGYYNTTSHGGNMIRAEAGGIYEARSYPLTVGSQGISGSQTLAGPLVGKFEEIYPYQSGHISTPSTWPEISDLLAGIRTPTMTLPGTQVYSYQNSSNVKTYAAGAIDFTKRWKSSAASPAPAVEETFTWATNPDIVPGVNGSGYLDNTYTINNPGRVSLASIDSTVDNEGWIQRINSPSNSTWIWGVSDFQQRADEYTAPTPYAEDVWDTESEWDSNSWAGANANQWPKHITPSSIKVIQATPSSVTTSQSGIKYVRASGIIRHQLQVEYPPMTETDFREFESVHAAARGQATPMYFDFYGYGSGSDVTLAFNRIDANKTSLKIPAKETSAIGSKYMLAEGFEANDTEVIKKGEFLIVGGSLDGGLAQVTSDADSNIFGEAKFRMAVGLRSAFNPGDHMYTRPLHAIVTIAEDTLEYTIGKDQLYRFSIRFDWDTWK